MARHILGTHRFLHLVICNRCGLKWDAATCDRAAVGTHIRDCQPDLAVTR